MTLARCIGIAHCWLLSTLWGDNFGTAAAIKRTCGGALVGDRLERNTSCRGCGKLLLLPLWLLLLRLMHHLCELPDVIEDRVEFGRHDAERHTGN